MYEGSVNLIEMPEHDSVSVCVFCDHDDLVALGERIQERIEQAYMNGYNWDAVIRRYADAADPNLMAGLDSDPEAGMASIYTRHTPANLAKMRRLESLIRAMLADEAALMQFIEKHCDEIEWD